MPLRDRLVGASREFLLTVLGYEILIVGGTALFLVVAMLVGYLPYTDHPGPGWYGPTRTVGELPMVAQWLRLSPWAPVIYGIVIFVIVKPLSMIMRMPRVVVRGVGSLLAIGSAAVYVLATGWYFAFAPGVLWAAILLAIAYGGWYLPRVLYSGQGAVA